MASWRILAAAVSVVAMGGPALAQGYIQQGGPSGGYVQPGQPGNPAYPHGGGTQQYPAHPRQATYPHYPQQRPSYPQPMPSDQAQGYPQQQPSRSASNGPSEAEMQMRIEMLKRSMGSAGIFTPFANELRRPSPPANEPGGSECEYYTSNAACNAHMNHDDWAAQDIENGRADGSTEDWYGGR
jgi:hypothetical protein